ncbi:FAD-binding oxidoreductase [Kribbella italica]|uniref:FAD/FMN-containing dehydrogenase n=1 Tax=Kribbella italica TaxID=1540520 RepID=A0A7W9JCE4_9ACTN|nr:FAD-binding oxidoreductase [Kribbella italica]MBB5839140.1 FAD/FMN-containing dehydrogenase [Kribbella italica]
METWTPETDGYDDQRTGFQRRDPHRPARIFAATSATDIQEAVRYARDHELRLAVQASGHGHTTPTDGVLVTTSGFAGVTVDPEQKTATIQAGATWQQVTAATSPYGLAPLSGSFPGVGAISYTLGGGLGLMARKYGFAADHVRRIDLVTPGGELRSVTPDYVELFWALRGGGGNFGVVTELEIDLFEVATVAGGSLYYDLATTPDVLQTWREWTATVPEEVTSAVGVLVLPDLPMVPAPLRGKHIAQLQLCLLTDLAQAEQLIAPLRALGEPVMDTFGEIPYAESGRIFAEPEQPHGYRAQNLLLADLDPVALSTIPKLAGPEAGAMCVIGIRHLGGALSRPPAIPNAVGRREAQYALTVLSPGEQDLTQLHRSILEPWTSIGRQLNFSFGPLTPDQIAEAYEPADLERLRRIKNDLDPTGLLQPNHVI